MKETKPMRMHHFHAISPAERIVTLEIAAKDERSARRKIRRSKRGRQLRSIMFTHTTTLPNQ